MSKNETTQPGGAPPPFSVERKHPRIPLTIEIECEGAGRTERFLSKDVSGGGAFLYSTRVYPMDAKLKLSFHIPYHRERITVAGRVVRHSQDPQSGLIDGMGIEFLDLDEKVRESLDRYVNETHR